MQVLSVTSAVLITIFPRAKFFFEKNVQCSSSYHSIPFIKYPSIWVLVI